MQVYAWMESQLSIFGIWWKKCYILPRTNPTTRKIKYEETRRVTPHRTSIHKTKPRFQPSTTILIWAMLIMSRRTRSFLNSVRCCSFLRITKQWLKWSSKAEVQQWDTCQEPTELRLIGCLIEWIWTPKSKSNTLTPKTNSQTYWQREISNVMNGIIFCVCSTLAISAYFAARRISACPAALKRWRHGFTRNTHTTQDVMLEKNIVFDFAKSDCVEKPGCTRGTLSKSLVEYREAWSKRIQSRRSVEFSRTAKRCTSVCKYEETRRDTRRPRTPEFPRRFNKYEETRHFRKLRNRRQRRNLATQSPCINRLRTVHGEGFLDCETQMRSRPGGSNEASRCERSHMVFFKSVTLQAAVHLGTDCTENLRSTKNQSQKSLRQLFQVTQKLISDQTEITGITTIDWRQLMWRQTTLLTDRAVQFATAKSYVFFWLSAMSGRHQYWTSQSMECKNKCFFWKHVISKIWIESTENKWNSSGNFPRIHYIREDIGHFCGLDRRRNGTEVMSANLMENGTKLLRIWCSALLRAGILYFVPSEL